jgi:ABC-2 type transport system permease protein
MLRLFEAELIRYWTLYRRYPADVIGNLVFLSATFYALLIGSRYVAGPSAQFGGRVDAIIVGYWLWTVLIFALVTMAAELQTEALTGTLEQLSLSGHGLTRIMLVRGLAAVGFNVALTLVMLGSMLLLTGRRLLISAPVAIPLGAVLVGAYGLSLGLGALALLFKRVQHLIQMAHVALLFLVMAPVESFSTPAWVIAQVFPIAPAASLLRLLMVDGQPLDGRLAAVVAVNAFGYFAAGVWLFRWADREARRRALLGQY